MRSRSYFGNKVNKIKLYKKGKLWVAASMTFITLGLSAFSTVDANQVTSSSSINVSSLSKEVISSVTASSVSSSNKESNSSVNASSTSSSSEEASSSVNASSASSSSKEASSSVNTSSVNSSNKESNSSVNASSVSSSNKESNSSVNASSVNSSNKETSSDTSNASSSSVIGESSTNLKSNNDLSSEELANGIKQNNIPTGTFTKTTNAATDDMMQKLAKGGILGFDPYYGSWTIYFEDEDGNTIYPQVGFTNASSMQVESMIKPYVEYIESKGYVYKSNNILSFTNNFYAFNYVTLKFGKAPLVRGGKVTVKYVDSTTGQVLKTGMAKYENSDGDPSNTPYVGYTYTTSPATIKGYTLSKTPSNATGTVTKQVQTVIYEYTPNQETAKIQIIDDSEGGKVINTVTVNGTYGSTSTYDINSYLDSNYPNYNVESDNWPGSITWNSSNDGTVPTYQVKLTHKTQTSTDTKKITQTIKYQYSDGTQAEPTKTTTITFTRLATKDLVTGNVTYGSWTNETGTDEFPAVQSPQIPGYTASYSQSTAITGVTPDTPDNTQTIIYVPNKETLTIVYYDMDEQKVLQEKTLQGDYNTAPNYNYQSVIQGYINEGYKVAKDTIPTSGLKFDNTGNQHYEVDLTHTTTTLPANSEGLTKVITHTINYVDSSGKTVAPDVVQTITYTRGATKDNVTGQITYTDWTTTTNPAEFPSVASPNVSGYTPSQQNSGIVPVNSNSADSNETIVYTKNGGSQTPTGSTSTVTETINYINSSGVVLHTPTKVTITFKRNSDGTYTAVGNDDFPAVSAPEISGYTPDVSSIPEIDNVKATDANIEKTIVYSPVQSSITITYYDETSKKVIKTDTLSGNYNSSPDYDANAIISVLEKDGYEEVSSNLPSSLIYTNSPQSYTVDFKHTYTTSTQSATVTQTINYKYANGEVAANSVNKQLIFTRTETRDNVTGNIQYSPWSPTSGEFPSVISPTITGYTPSEAESQAITNVDGSSSNNIQNIVYNANQETIDVNYIDQTTGKTIKTIALTGAYNTTSSYTTADEIKALEQQGYALVQDNYPTDGAKFDEDGVVKSYNVILKENVTTSTESQTVSQTIRYVDSNGKQIAPDKDTSLTFTRDVSTNQVTGEKTYGNWTPATGEFPQVQSPSITGYTVTPGEEESQAVSVTPDSSNNVQTITYTANQERAEVQYIDGTTGQVLSTADLSGAYGTTDSYNPASTIQKYVNEGYKLSSDDFPANGIVYNYDGTVPVYKIVFEHNTRTDTASDNPDNVPADELTHTVQQTINYVYSDGTKAADSVTNSVTFNRSVTVDQVTHQVVSEGDWTPASGTYPSVTSPTITGYTPDVTATTANNDVLPTDSNSTVTVTYTANKEHAVVNYVDDATGKVVASQTVDGTFGSTVTYDPTSEENKLKGEGYTIGSSDLPSNDQIKFTQDGQVPTYTVHLNEGTTTYTPSNNPDNLDLTKKVTRTINYVDADGKQLATSVTQTITFTRNATVNKVTGKVTYSNWQPSGNDSYDAVESQVISGYTTTQTVVNAENSISASSNDQVVNVIYTADKPVTPEQKPSESVKKPVRTAKSTADQLKAETVKKVVSMKQTSSANEEMIRVAEQSTKIEKQTPNDSAAQPSESKNTLPQTGEDSTSHTLFGELLIVLSGLLGFFDIGKRKKDKEE